MVSKKKSSKKRSYKKKTSSKKKIIKRGGNESINFSLVNALENLEKKYSKYKVTKEDLKENPCKKKQSSERTLMKHQAFITEFMKNETDHRGLLLFHEMGSGKTLASLSVSESIDRRVIVLLPAALKSNWIKELGKLNPEYKEPSNIKQLSESDQRKIKKEIINKIAKKYDFISHNAYNTAEQLKKLVDKNNSKKNDENDNNLDNDMVYKTFKKNNLDNKLLIIDEVHNLLSNVMSENSKNGTAIFDMIMNARNLKILALSATPAVNDPYELALLFNMLRGKMTINNQKFTAFPDQYHTFKEYFINDIQNVIKNKLIFQERINGLVSFVKGAREDDIEIFPKQTNIVEKIQMSEYQYKYYGISRYEEFEKEKKGKQFKNLRTSAPKYKKPFSDDTIDFKTNSRTVSNFVFPEDIEKPKSKKLDETIAEYNKRVVERLDELTKEHLVTKLHIYSPKIKKIIENISKLKKGLILIYSNFVTVEGLGILIRVLQFNGYTNYLDKSKGKDYFKFAEYSGNVDNKNRDTIIKKYTSKNNQYGKDIRLLLITAAGAEGLDLRNIRQVHIMEPYWHNVRTRQAIGRAVRLCSHVDLPVNERNVTVYIYIATTPEKKITKIKYKEKETTDEFLYKRSIKKEKLLGTFLRAMKEMAIDCKLNFERNKGNRGLNNINECLACSSSTKSIYHPNLEIHSLPGNSNCKRPNITITEKITYKEKEYGVSDINKLYDLKQEPPLEVGDIYKDEVILY
jgi:superfamily II DNA or RNA helicase